MNDEKKADKVEGLPIINQIGVDKAAERNLLNEAVKAQLELVYDEAKHYLPSQRAPAVSPQVAEAMENRMPHEWGSMDTYDDMRNSMRLAVALMDDLLDSFQAIDDQQKHIRGLIREHGAACAIHDTVLKCAGLDPESDWWEILDEEANE